MSIKKQHQILYGLIFFLGFAGVLVLTRAHFRNKMVPTQPVKPEVVVRFGDVMVDSNTREIRFDGKVQQNDGWVRFLIYLDSYRWLKEEAAIVSTASLTDLQKAIAMLNWQLWDHLWHRETTGEEVAVVLTWQDDTAEANEFVQVPDRLGIGDLVFLGSPFFDPLFLDRCTQTIVCIALQERPQCPLFFLQESVEKKFTRVCGTAGYQLNGKQLPPPGTKVTVIIRVPMYGI
jgi:hypothetical protein